MRANCKTKRQLIFVISQIKQSGRNATIEAVGGIVLNASCQVKKIVKAINCQAVRFWHRHQELLTTAKLISSKKQLSPNLPKEQRTGLK